MAASSFSKDTGMNATSDTALRNHELFEIVPPLITTADLTTLADALAPATPEQITSLLKRLSVEIGRAHV